jgi:transposase
MSKRRTAYPPEFRRQMVELARSGRNPEELSREFLSQRRRRSATGWPRRTEMKAGVPMA